MIGPLMKLIKREILVSAAFMQFHRECGSPSPRLEGGNRYPRPVGLAVHRENKYMILGFHSTRIFWDLSLKKVLGLNRGANAGKTLSQTSHSYQLEALGNLEAFLKTLKLLTSRKP